jgi:formylglycine-generating enzyme required for sulfatase activity
VPRTVKEKLFSNLGFNFRLFGAITGGLVIIGLVVWGASSLFSNLPAGPKPTRTPQIRVTFISQPSSTIISEPNQIDTLSPTSALGIGSTITGKDGMTLLYVPAGEFLMGSFFDHDNERMPHTVTLNRFWIDKTEVTVGMYHLCVAAGTCLEPINKTSRTNSTYYDNAKFENYPVIYVNWGMAKTYCEWAGQRLPTEAEWEKAARGNDGRDYPWGNSEPKRDILNFNNQIGDTTEVGKYPKGTSPYGALDMAGNLWEWVADWYGDGYSARDVSNPLGPTSGQFRILRGGAWNKDEKNVHTSTRLPVYASDASNTIGFRCAMSATP